MGAIGVLFCENSGKSKRGQGKAFQAGITERKPENNALSQFPSNTQIKFIIYESIKMKIKAAIPAEQLPAIIETVKATEFEGHKKYLIEIGLDEAAATTFATAISEIVSAMYSEELGEAEEMPEADAAAASDTPEEARNFAGRVNLAYKEIKSGNIEKAGATWSAANRAKIKEVYGKVKELHDEATASKEESAPEPEKKEISLADYLQTKGN